MEIINARAFANCTSLTSIIFPYCDYDSEIDEFALSGCPNLKAIYFYSSEEQWEEYVGIETSATIYYYGGEESKYWHFVDGKPTLI